MKTASRPEITPAWIDTANEATGRPYSDAELCMSLSVWLAQAKVIACAITDSQSRDPSEMQSAGYSLFNHIVDVEQLLEWYEQTRADRLRLLGVSHAKKKATSGSTSAFIRAGDG